MTKALCTIFYQKKYLKTKKLHAVLIAFFVFALNVYAQQAVVSGVVLDEETGEEAPFATVALFPEGEDAPSDGTTTDLNGKFSLSKVKAGSYKLAVSFMGYTTVELPLEIFSGQRIVDLGAIAIKPVALSIEGVEVTAMERSAVSHLDRVSYRAEDFETARGGTAAELLNKLPSISVSPDGDVSVRGTTDFIVYLNGRPTQMEASMLLSQIPANSIVGIDIISVPSAAYDAQGKGGIINITTKTQTPEGLSVSATGTLGGAPWGNRTDDISGYKLNDDRYGSGLNVVYGKKGWLLQGGFSYNRREVNSDRTGSANILDPESGAYKHMIASGLKPEWYENITANFGFDKMISSKAQLSGSYFYSSRTEGRTANYLYRNFFGDANRQPIPGIPVDESYTFNPNTGIREGFFNTVNLEYSTKTDNNSGFVIGGLYETSLLTHDVNNPNIEYNPITGELGAKILHYHQRDETPLQGFRINAGYAKTFDNGYTLSLGFQPQYVNISGGFDYDTLGIANDSWGAYSDLENEIDLDRFIYAGYADLAGQYGKLSFKTGLRLEYTDQTLKIKNPDYFSLFDRTEQERFIVKQPDWFPSLHTSYQIADADRISFAASRRISRAPVKNMAPFLYRRHLEVYVVGDPQLEPEYINTIELSYGKSAGDQQFTLTGFYRGVEDAVFRVNTVFEEELVLIRTFTNAGQTTSIGGELNANLEWGRRFRLFLGGSLYHFHLKADIFGYREDHRSANWSLKGNANMMLSKQLRLVADFDIRSAEITAQGRNKMRYLANAALMYNPEKLKAWSFNLRALNILNSNTRGISARAYSSEGIQIFYQDTDFYWNGPIAEISVNYRFNWRNQSTTKQDTGFGRNEF
jgi:outer membrane receptor protein involved in Fe transport